VRLLLLLAAAVGLWLWLGRRGGEGRRVVVAWDDGSELELRSDSDDRARLVELAGEALS
jgi:hypothetical protein